MRIVTIIASTLALLAAPLAHAGEPATKTREILESGKLVQGEQDFAARLAKSPADDETRFGLGLIRLARTIEHYGQTQYRYGLRPTKSASLPFLRFPVPVNPKPEALTYEGQREALKTLLADLTAVEATLAPMAGGNVKVKLDLQNIRFDLRGDGKAEDTSRVSDILVALRITSVEKGKKPEPFEVSFDTADALWLRGYCHVLSGTLEFLLAYDWHVAFEHSGRLFYPRILPVPLSGAVSAPEESRADRMFGVSDGLEIADLIALLHDTSWPVAEPARMTLAHAHFKQVTGLSRLTWKAILAETDDDHEWIPGPHQKNGVLTGIPVTRPQVDEWLAALDDFDAVLDGKLLIPYWRFAKGLNLKKVFLEPRPFDLVLWFTGHAAAPYVEDGPVMEQEVWRKRQEIFGGNFPGYAVWFN